MYIHPTQKTGGLRIYSLPELIERNGLNSSAGAFVYPGTFAREHFSDNPGKCDSCVEPMKRNRSKYLSRPTS